MPYYGARGDYVGGRSNYYRGDPFIGAIIGGVARAVGAGPLIAKAGRWVAGRITGQGLKRAAQTAVGVAGTAVVGTAVNRALGGGAQPRGVRSRRLTGGPGRL